MCGIAGILVKSSFSDAHRECLRRMAGVMTHRGPDGEGFYFDDSIGMAHRRLSIIDLEGGKQPLCNEDGTVWTVFNGEIYNYLELKNRLLAKGHTFATNSDTEVIVHLYEDYASGLFEHLRGMFAIAVWDARNRRLILGRDRLGKKPLYYSFFGDTLAFASEIKSLLQIADLPRELDHEALSDYFSLMYVPSPKSVFKSIRKVQPGHYLVVDRHGHSEKRYWDLRFDQVDDKSEERWCEELLGAYEEAVRLRLRSDVPLGAFLSGGVDSSSVVALISKLNNGKVNTCSVGFDEKEFDESAAAATFANTLHTNHHEERVRPDALPIIKQLAWFYDEPFADSSAVPTYYVSQAARRHVTVALSGDGGDENFAGYRRYYHDLAENRFRAYFPPVVRKYIFGGLGQIYPKLDWAPQVLRAQATFRAFSRSPVEGYFYSVAGIKPELKKLLLSRDFRKLLNGYDSVGLFEDFYNRHPQADHLSRLQYLDIKTYLVEDILVKVDRASMANSLEVRCPILDHKFMELVTRIPSSLKLKGARGKYIFKKALSSLLPRDVLTRQKQGFAVPLAIWFRNELKELSGDLLLSEDPLGVLETITVRKLWDRHQSGRSDFSTALWMILMYRLWQNKFLSTADAHE
jgi:asparagine synthase (glutamine-hydrolysing)